MGIINLSSLFFLMFGWFFVFSQKTSDYYDVENNVSLDSSIIDPLIIESQSQNNEMMCLAQCSQLNNCVLAVYKTSVSMNNCNLLNNNFIYWSSNGTDLDMVNIFKKKCKVKIY